MRGGAAKPVPRAVGIVPSVVVPTLGRFAKTDVYRGGAYKNAAAGYGINARTGKLVYGENGPQKPAP